MDIIKITENVRDKAKAFGRYRFVAGKSGVSYEWLVKFAVGKIPNPTIENINKLIVFFNDHDTSNSSKQNFNRRDSDKNPEIESD